MTPTTLPFKLIHPNAFLPTRGTEHSAGLDLYAAARITDDERPWLVGYDTGVAFAIPQGFVGLCFPRSSVKFTGIRLSNSVGVIDSDYRGTVKAWFDRTKAYEPDYQVGQKVVQLVIVPMLQLRLEPVDELDQTARGEGGFGSTDALQTALAAPRSIVDEIGIPPLP